MIHKEKGGIWNKQKFVDTLKIKDKIKLTK